MVDEQRVQRFLDEVASGVDRPMASATLAIETDGRVAYSPSQTERRLDVARTRERLVSALTVGDQSRVTLAVREAAPPVTDPTSPRRGARASII